MRLSITLGFSSEWSIRVTLNKIVFTTSVDELRNLNNISVYYKELNKSLPIAKNKFIVKNDILSFKYVGLGININTSERGVGRFKLFLLAKYRRNSRKEHQWILVKYLKHHKMPSHLLINVNRMLSFSWMSHCLDGHLKNTFEEKNVWFF